MLTEAQRTQLAEDGYVVADGLLDAGEVFNAVLSGYSAVLDAVEADLVELGLLRARGFLPSIFQLLAAPRLLRAAQDLIGPDVYITPQEHVRIKFPDGTLLGPNSTEEEVRLSFDCRFQPPSQPSGRPGLPGFFVASGEGGAGVVTEAKAWIRQWEEARIRLLRASSGRRSPMDQR